jgi:hypothetical protein
LHEASRRGHDAVVSLLLNSGASTDIKDGRRAWEWTKGLEYFTRLIFGLEDNYDDGYNHGKTAFDCAIKQGYEVTA